MENHSWARHERDVRLHCTKLQLAMVSSQTANIQEIILEKMLVLMILIPLRLLRRLEDKKKGDLELHFGCRFLNTTHNPFYDQSIQSFVLKR